MQANLTESATNSTKLPDEEAGTATALRAIRERLWVILGVLAVSLAAAGAYLVTADPVYEAQANILVAPVPGDETILRSLGLIAESTDPTLVVETSSQLVDTPDTAERAAERLGGSWTPEQVADAVTVDAVPLTNIVAVVAAAPSGAEASEIADAFARSAIEERTAELHERIDDLLPRLREQAGAVTEEAATELASEVAQLEALRSQSDPTLMFETPAPVPESPVSPRPMLTLLIATVVGLMIGTGGTVGLRALDPILRREEQLRRLLGLPILGRIPRESRGGKGPLRPEATNPKVREAYRTLRAMITSSAPESPGPRSILVTSASPSEGKTTTAINLAVSLAVAGSNVILIDCDLRRPGVGPALDLKADNGVTSVLVRECSLQDALIPITPYGTTYGTLRALIADGGAESVELFSLPAGRRLIDEAERLAEYVIVDSPPLTEVIDALPFAHRVDEVLLVARLGTSRIGRIKELGELLAGNGIQPAGFALLGISRPGTSDYYS